MDGTGGLCAPVNRGCWLQKQILRPWAIELGFWRKPVPGVLQCKDLLVYWAPSYICMIPDVGEAASMHRRDTWVRLSWRTVANGEAGSTGTPDMCWGVERSKQSHPASLPHAREVAVLFLLFMELSEPLVVPGSVNREKPKTQE
jgi:hypothetical protein